MRGQRWRRRLVLANGVFLIAVGGVQVVLELLGHYAGVGPYADIFQRSPYTIGWMEAHGLAFIIGVLLVAVAARDGRRFWHGLGIAVHALLGTANVLFWNSFVVFGFVAMGLAATVMHAVLVLAHAAALAASRGASPGSR